MPQIILHTCIDAPIDRCFDLSRSVDLHQNSLKHTKEQAIKGVVAGLMKLNDSVCWRANHFGIPLKLCSKITVFTPPYHFTDEMLSGPFHSFSHKHNFSTTNGITLMEDIFNYRSPLGFLGKIADSIFLKKYMINILTQRNHHIKSIAESNEWKLLLDIEKKYI